MPVSQRWVGQLRASRNEDAEAETVVRGSKAPTKPVKGAFDDGWGSGTQDWDGEEQDVAKSKGLWQSAIESGVSGFVSSCECVQGGLGFSTVGCCQDILELWRTFLTKSPVVPLLFAVPLCLQRYRRSFLLYFSFIQRVEILNKLVGS